MNDTAPLVVLAALCIIAPFGANSLISIPHPPP